MESQRIKRIRNKTANFTVVDNDAFKRNDLSLGAKGLLIFLLTLPDDWQIYKSSLHNHFTNGKHAISTAFDELKNMGYIKSELKHDDKGKFAGYDYTVHEHPLSENPITDNPITDNQTLLNTNNNKITNKTYLAVLEKWNSLNIIVHSEKVVDSKWKKRHNDQVKLYGEEATIKAIENYARIINDDAYYFNYRWSLWDFIARGLDKFVDDAMPFGNFTIYEKKEKKIDYTEGLNIV
jgi:hypothetical protein